VGVGVAAEVPAWLSLLPHRGGTTGAFGGR
jgi:hypothetical protein